jgi:hypothetical protein
MWQIKGSALQGLLQFIRQTFGEDGFQAILKRASPEARALVTQPVLANEWYSGPLTMELRRCVIDEFYRGQVERIRALGRFSAELTLRGVYKVAVRIGSPTWFVGRLSMLFERMLRPGKVRVIDHAARRVVVRVSEFEDRSGIMEEVLAGFAEAGLQISGCHDVRIILTRRLSEGDPFTELVMTWGA